jgi:hypothetical protein
LYGGSMIAVALVSFLLTLWLIKPRPALEPPNYTAADIGPLAAQRVVAYEDVGRAAREAGLKLSRSMKGHIDTISRVNDREVAIAGWLADPEYGDGTPLKIVAFVGGPVVGNTDTKGDRPDVTHALGLEFGSEKNVAFQLNFACRPADQPVLVGLGSRSQYLPLPIGPCP